MDVEVTGLRELTGALTKAGFGMAAAAEAVLVKGAVTIKKDAAGRVSGLAHAPAYPASISYDLYHLPAAVEAQIGPDKERRQGALGNLLEFGSVNNAPIPHLSPALDAEAPRFEAALGAVAGRALDG